MSSLEHEFSSSSAAPATSAGIEQPILEASWMRGFSLAKKLNASLICSALILLIVAGMASWTATHYSSAGRYVADVAGLEVRTTHAVMDLDDAQFAIRDYRDRGVTTSLGEVGRSLDGAHENILYTKEWISEQMPPETHAKVAGFVADIEALQREWDRIDPRPDDAQVAAFETELATVRAEITAFARDLRGTLAPAARDLFNGLDSSILMNLIVVAIGVVAGMALARAVNRNVVGAISAITGAMKKLAAGETDTVIPGITRADEIGDMARALEVFRADSVKLGELGEARMEDAEKQLAQQQLLSEQMRELRQEKSRLLEQMANGFEISVGEVITAVSAASDQLKATSQTMGKLAEGSEEQAKSAAEAMAKANANVTAAAAATDQFALSIAEISRQASSSALLARDATELVTTASKRMNDLSQAADEIGEIAGLIQSIAQRTNLLALNASIEAARGGEAGRGFAVVASEVKELAMQTSNATSSVADRIAAMQATTKSSAADLSSIVRQIGEVEQAAVMIASAVDQQSVSGDELARNIDVVAAGTGTVGERLAALLTASEDTGASADEVVASANALGAHADDLRAKAGRFIEDVRRSARELEAGDRRQRAA